MTPRQVEDYLQDILDAISAAQQFIAEMSFEDFAADQKTVFAVTAPLKLSEKQPRAFPNLYGKTILKFLGKALPECEIKSFTNISGSIFRCLGHGTARPPSPSARHSSNAQRFV